MVAGGCPDALSVAGGGLLDPGGRSRDGDPARDSGPVVAHVGQAVMPTALSDGDTFDVEDEDVVNACDGQPWELGPIEWARETVACPACVAVMRQRVSS